ncbi:hypothetical protein [Micromonospora sp. NBC_00421]|uniref:hypothetical protein n=1 Tax=Micromonospora sp. NBC_00421 TaxID=2975976 RepID=UPI002E1AAE44
MPAGTPRSRGRRPGLLILLSRLSVEATDHLTQLDSGRQADLTDRFMTWARPPAY